MVKSPFFVIEDAVSPAKCELIIDKLGIQHPSFDENENPLKHERIVTDYELLSYVKDAVLQHRSAIEERYDARLGEIQAPIFQQYFENPKKPCETHGCDNAKYMRRKWVKIKDTDLVAYLWLKDYNSGVPLDPRFEVYGGKLEFPAYDFSLVPTRGTMVIFPGGPHFITAISPVLVGSLEQVKLSLKLDVPSGGWTYQPDKFPGTYQQWFS